MRKILFVIPLVLLVLTGCGKKEVVCSGSVEEDGVKYEAKIVGVLKDNKIDSAHAIMKFSDENTAKSMCSIFELANKYAENEKDKIDFKCEGSQITINSLNTLVDDEADKIKGLTADEFIELLTKDNKELTCKK